ncbi:MAG: NYN domain-containing protein [Nanobdellota archaeon]
MTNIKINQNVAILCDGNNIERSIQKTASANTMINFDSLIPRLLKNRGLNRMIYFREGFRISDKLADRLYSQFYGSVIPCHKSADIPLTIKATQLASKIDTIIIMSGDSDYVDLVKYLKNEGVRVEIAAVKETTSKYLLDEVDFFHPIGKDDVFTYGGSNKTNSSNYQKRSSAKNTSRKNTTTSTKHHTTKKTTSTSSKKNAGSASKKNETINKTANKQVKKPVEHLKKRLFKKSK